MFDLLGRRVDSTFCSTRVVDVLFRCFILCVVYTCCFNLLVSTCVVDALFRRPVSMCVSTCCFDLFDRPVRSTPCFEVSFTRVVSTSVVDALFRCVFPRVVSTCFDLCGRRVVSTTCFEVLLARVVSTCLFDLCGRRIASRFVSTCCFDFSRPVWSTHCFDVCFHGLFWLVSTCVVDAWFRRPVLRFCWHTLGRACVVDVLCRRPISMCCIVVLLRLLEVCGSTSCVDALFWCAVYTCSSDVFVSTCVVNVLCRTKVRRTEVCGLGRFYIYMRSADFSPTQYSFDVLFRWVVWIRCFGVFARPVWSTCSFDVLFWCVCSTCVVDSCVCLTVLYSFARVELNISVLCWGRPWGLPFVLNSRASFLMSSTALFYAG